jgi:hypothetical protein
MNSKRDKTPSSALSLMGGLFRAVGLLDAAALSVRNSGRRLPRARAALLRYRLATAQPGGRL